MIRVGTAGWSLYRAGAGFDGDGTHLQRYARTLNCAEINSSFYRQHSRSTYAKWAAVTPTSFRFAVKMPRAITHEGRLRRARGPLREFAGAIAGLGRRLGPLLVQLPPSLEFEPRVARTFFAVLREECTGPAVCEPRHASWFTDRAEKVFVAHCIGRVAADPAPVAWGAVPGGWPGIVYCRLHGSPRTYWSSYEPEALRRWSGILRVQPGSTQAWCIFDNTAGGAALANAVQTYTLSSVAPAKPEGRKSARRRIPTLHQTR